MIDNERGWIYNIQGNPTKWVGFPNNSKEKA